MIAKIYKNKTEESGVALVIAVVISVILVSIAALGAISTINAFSNASDYRNSAYYDVAIDTAFGDAINYVNNPENEPYFNDITRDSPRQGVIRADTEINYEWYLEPFETKFENLTYKITVSAWSGVKTGREEQARARKVSGFLVSVPTEGGVWRGERIFYSPTRNSVFGYGLFAGGNLDIFDTARLEVFNSASPSTAVPLSRLSIGTNGVFSSKGASLPEYNLRSYNQFGLEEVACLESPLKEAGEICSYPRLQRVDYGVSLSEVSRWVQNTCDGQLIKTPIYRDGNGVALNGVNNNSLGDIATTEIDLSPGINCFNELPLFGDVIISGNSGVSSGNPALIFVNGSLNFNRNPSGNTSTGLQFNSKSDIDGDNNPLSYRFYVSGNVGIGSNSAASRNVSVRALISAAGNCYVNTTSPSFNSLAKVSLEGALVCGGKVDVKENSEIRVDQQISQVSSDRNRSCEIGSETPQTHNCIYRIWEIVNVKSES